MSTVLFAQNEFHFEGDIILGDVSSYPYKIVFEETQGVIKGYSITDFKGQMETKSTISGVVDYERNTIEFKEDELVYAYDLDFKDKFCFISFKGNLNDVGSKKQIQGRFNSMFENGERYVFGLINIFKTDPPVAAKRDEVLITSNITSSKDINTTKVNVESSPEALAKETAIQKKKKLISSAVSKSIAIETIENKKDFSVTAAATSLAAAEVVRKKKKLAEKVSTAAIGSSEKVTTASIEVKTSEGALAVAVPKRITPPKEKKVLKTGIKAPKKVRIPEANITEKALSQKPVETKKTPIKAAVASAIKKASTSQVNTVNKDEVLNVYCEEDSLAMFIYDEDRGDDDAINLYIDGMPVLVSYRVTPRVKKVLFKIIDDSVQVKINAINTGIIGRNTIRFDIKDGKKLIRTISNLDANDSATMVFYKE